MILEDATYEAYGYYPKDLLHHSGKPILAYCDLCGEFKVTRKRSYRTFCMSCSLKGKIVSDDAKHNMSEAKKGKTHTDETKRKMRDAQLGEKGNNYGKCGKEAHSWKGGKVERVCKVCGKIFYTKQCKVKNGYGKYCSNSCRMKAQRHNARPTKTAPEKAFEDICKKYALPFTFVGDGSFWLGNANPDFVHNTKKIAVEVFGDYWHGQLVNRNVRYTGTVEGRTAQLKAEGYKTIILWESDLMRDDADKFVLRELRKEQRKKK